MTLAIEVSELRKSFGEVEAVRGVSFGVEAGEIFGFLGPNGAGKTTTINMLCPLARPTGGSAHVAGHDIVEAEFCDRIAIMDQGVIVTLDTPDALKAQIGADRVTIQTGDDAAAVAALAEHFELEAKVAEGAVTFYVPKGEEFVPRLFA